MFSGLYLKPRFSVFGERRIVQTDPATSFQHPESLVVFVHRRGAQTPEGRVSRSRLLHAHALGHDGRGGRHRAVLSALVQRVHVQVAVHDAVGVHYVRRKVALGVEGVGGATGERVRTVHAVEVDAVDGVLLLHVHLRESQVVDGLFGGLQDPHLEADRVPEVAGRQGHQVLSVDEFFKVLRISESITMLDWIYV